MFYSLEEKELEKLTEISEITGTDYEITGKFIPVDNMMAALEDLLCEYHHVEEQLADLQYEVDNNYELKRIDMYEEYGVSERDFC